MEKENKKAELINFSILCKCKGSEAKMKGRQGLLQGEMRMINDTWIQEDEVD